MKHMLDDVGARPVETVPLWKNRDYLLLWIGQIVSVTGTQVTQIAFPLLVLALTGSPAVAGLVAASRTLPYVLFTLPAGALVDRWERKRTMISCGMGSAIALGSIAVAYLVGSITIPHIVIVWFVEGTFAVVYGLAETSALPHVVSKEQLPAAVAQQQMQYSVGSIIGPPLGGALYGISAILPFMVDAASYTASAFSLAAIRRRFTGLGNHSDKSLKTEITEGIHWLWNHELIRYMAFLTGTLNFAGSGITLIIVVLAKDQGASSAMTGLIFAAAGVGGVIGALVAPAIQRRLSFGQAIVTLNWVFAAILLLYSIAVSPFLIMLILFLESLIGPSYDTVQLTYRLAIIPDSLLGRVNSVFRLVAAGMSPFGVALTGFLLERAGATTTAGILGGFLIAIALLTSFNRHVRRAPALPASLPSA
jgi:MFS family permease